MPCSVSAEFPNKVGTLKLRVQYQHMSEFKWGRMFGLWEANFSYCDILAPTGPAAMTAILYGTRVSYTEMSRYCTKQCDYRIG